MFNVLAGHEQDMPDDHPVVNRDPCTEGAARCEPRLGVYWPDRGVAIAKVNGAQSLNDGTEVCATARDVNVRHGRDAIEMATTEVNAAGGIVPLLHRVEEAAQEIRIGGRSSTT